MLLKTIYRKRRKFQGVKLSWFINVVLKLNFMAFVVAIHEIKLTVLIAMQKCQPLAKLKRNW